MIGRFVRFILGAGMRVVTVENMVLWGKNTFKGGTHQSDTPCDTRAGAILFLGNSPAIPVVSAIPWWLIGAAHTGANRDTRYRGECDTVAILSR